MSATSAPTRRWIFVSDLHLGDGSQREGRDAALVQLLGEVARPGGAAGGATTGQRTLVLLGDTVDLNGRGRLHDDAVVHRLESLVAAHEPVFAALGACVRAGVDVLVVAGNHDLELARPVVTRALQRLLGADEADPGLGRVSVSPWIVHVPGVFYAEHGNQHYELNRVPAVLAVSEVADATVLPVTPMGAISPVEAWCPTSTSRPVGLLQALRALARQERLARTPTHLAAITREARATGLPVHVVQRLSRLTTYRFGTAVIGVLDRRWWRASGRDGRQPVLVDRAVGVHRVMVAAGCAVPAYVFGHDHRAQEVSLLDREPATYLNCGTWCGDVRGAGRDADEPALFPYVEVRHDARGVARHLRYWRWETPAEQDPGATSDPTGGRGRPSAG